jgi:hypothetical protein
MANTAATPNLKIAKHINHDANCSTASVEEDKM